MKKSLFKIAALAFTLALVSCEEDRVVYSGGDFVTFEDGGNETLSVFENAGTVDVPIYISIPRNEDVTVTLSTTNGEAVSGTDFVLETTTITIPANEEMAVAHLSVVDNEDFGEAKTFTLTIVEASAPDVNLGLSGDTGSFQKTVSIVNDDCPTNYNNWVGALDVEDVGYGITPGTGAVTPAGTCDVLRVVNNLPGFPGWPGTGAPGYFDVLFTPDFEGATTGTVEVLMTPVAPNGSYFATYEGMGSYSEDTGEIIIDYTVKAHTTSYSGPVAGTYYTGTNIITVTE